MALHREEWDMRQDNPLQGTGAWFNDRTGKLTASRMSAAMAFLKNGNEASERRKLKIEILAERLTDSIVPKYVTNEMQWGVEQEPFAKAAFERKTGLLINDVGFIPHHKIENCGASPDGICSDDFLFESKCPTTATHITWMLAGEVPEEHKPQMTLQAACAQKKGVWFCSFDPRLPEKQQLFIKKFIPTEEEIIKVEDEARIFLEEVEQMFAKLTLGE
jgi:hypothetical protein